MMAQWINWSEILSRSEVGVLIEGTALSRSEVELAAWSEDERDGQRGYTTQIGPYHDLFVWHSPEGEVRWEDTSPIWLAQEMLESLDVVLRAQGFVGTRHDDPAHRRVTYRREDGRLLDLRLLQHQPTTHADLLRLAKDFLSDADLDSLLGCAPSYRTPRQPSSARQRMWRWHLRLQRRS